MVISRQSPVSSRQSDAVGVLAIQGDFIEHQYMLERLGYITRQIRKASELDDVRALILPGGESTTKLKFVEEENLMVPLRRFHTAGRALFGTCAGAILLARRVSGPSQSSLGLMDIEVERNGYGRQIDSHADLETCPVLGEAPLPMVFIRAPVVSRVGPKVEVLATHRGQPVLVREGSVLASTFHPELADDLRVHRFFLERVAPYLDNQIQNIGSEIV